MKITPTHPSPVEGGGNNAAPSRRFDSKGKGLFHMNRHALKGAQRSMKMPHVISEAIRNPGRHCVEGRNKD